MSESILKIEEYDELGKLWKDKPAESQVFLDERRQLFTLRVPLTTFYMHNLSDGTTETKQIPLQYIIVNLSAQPKILLGIGSSLSHFLMKEILLLAKHHQTIFCCIT